MTMQRSGSDAWRRKYCLRWIAESAFSWMERVFGEYVTAKKLEGQGDNIEGIHIQPLHRDDEKSLRRKWVSR